MAQTKRVLSKVAEGMSKSTDKIQKLAEEAVRLNRIKDIQLAFKEVIKKNEELLQQTNENSEIIKYEKIIKNQKANLNYFNQETQKILQPTSSKNQTSETAINKEQFVEKMKKITEKIYQKEKNSIFNFVVEPNEHYKELEEYLNSVTNIPEDEKVLLKRQLLSENTTKLINYFGEEIFRFYAAYCNSLTQKIEKLSQEEIGTKGFSDAYENLMDVINSMIEKATNGITVSFDKNSLNLSISFPYNIIKKVNRQIVSKKTNNLANQSPLTDEERKEEIVSFRNQINVLFSEYFDKYENTINTLQNSLNDNFLNNFNKKLEILSADKEQFPHLTEEEKRQIINEIKDSYKQEKNDKYGEGFIDYLQEVIISNLSSIPFESLKNSVYGTEEFNRNYDNVYDGLEKLRNAIDDSPLTPGFLDRISFDNTTQKFSIEFSNQNVPKFEIQILSDKAIAAMKDSLTPMESEIDLSDLEEADPSFLTRDIDPNEFIESFGEYYDESKESNVTSEMAQTTDLFQNNDITQSLEETLEPVIPEPRTFDTVIDQTRESSIRDYLLKVEELNNAINLINQLNQKLTANLIYDFLDIRNVKNVIKLESEAKELDQKIIDIKLELSKDRIKFKQNFNEYIISIPEVKLAEVNSISFNDNNLNTFVAFVDEQLVDAENKIVELDKERQKCTDTTIANEINTQIDTILAFIESQNSLIARRIVSESENKEFDIVAFLQTRREKKKEIRERVKTAYENINQSKSEALDDNFEIKAGEGMPLPQSKSEMPTIEPINVIKKKTDRETSHHEDAPLNSTIVTQTIEEPFENLTEPGISNAPESVKIIPQPVEIPEISTSVLPEISEIPKQITDQIEYPDDDPRRNYAIDDPMRYNKIPEVPVDKFDAMFETPSSDSDELLQIDGDYLTSLFNNGNAKNSHDEDPIDLLNSQIDPRREEYSELESQIDVLEAQNEDMDPQTEDLEQQTEDLKLQTEDLEQQTEDLKLQTEDLEQQTEDLKPQTEDLEQQTEDLESQTEDFEDAQWGDIAAMFKDMNGSVWDNLDDSDEDELEANPDNDKTENSEENVNDMNGMLTINDVLAEVLDNDKPTSMSNKPKMIIEEELHETIRKLGHTIIEWTDSKGTIVRQDFKELYLSASNISENAYNNALEKLAELNVIDIEKYAIQTKMSKKEFEKVISKYNADIENEKIPKEVTIELRILNMDPVLTTQTVNRNGGLILEGDTITISRINKGIKVKYSEDLRNKLSDLNAKLRLINKGNHYSRTTADIEAQTPEQLLVFKDGRDINHDEYIVDIRVPGTTEPVFEYDLAEETEEKRHSL